MDVKALMDTMVTLECEVRGVPHPTITWYRRGEAITSSRQAQYVDRGLRLKIPHVQPSDAGQYTCKVTNVAGSAEKSFELEVYSKMFFIVFFCSFYLFVASIHIFLLCTIFLHRSRWATGQLTSILLINSYTEIKNIF